ncbi:hypothetical protein DAI22_05g123600 [Oryza sativa Japonica Group]|nr:hypothetical protein DAI22_05g123600 [Oryza sativa Japonica Group]
MSIVFQVHHLCLKLRACRVCSNEGSAGHFFLLWRAFCIHVGLLFLVSDEGFTSSLCVHAMHGKIDIIRA